MQCISIWELGTLMVNYENKLHSLAAQTPYNPGNLRFRPLLTANQS